jgi:hypothetical protein
MTSRILRMFPLHIGVFIAMAVLTNSAVLGESSSTTPTTPPASATSSERSASPDSPMPANSQVPPPQQTPNNAQGQSSSSSSQPHVLTYANPNSQVTVLEDTLIRVMTSQPLSSRQLKDGSAVLFTLSEDVIVDNVIVIPRGVTVHGELVQTRKAGVLTGRPELTLKLVSLDLGGRSYPLYTYQFKVQGTSKTKPTETKVKGGAVIGAIVGGLFSGSAKGETSAVGKLTGMGTGTALGAGVGAVASAATPGPILTIPAESQMDFHLTSPISVRTVSVKEAARLSQGLRPDTPVLYVRDATP